MQLLFIAWYIHIYLFQALFVYLYMSLLILHTKDAYNNSGNEPILATIGRLMLNKSYYIPYEYHSSIVYFTHSCHT